MAAKKTLIDAGLMSRALQGIGAAVQSGLSSFVPGSGQQEWFGPHEPLQPVAPANVEGRLFDYPVATNVNVRPRSNENISFEQLRALADSCDILRLVIETRKDQIESYDWEIVSKDE